MSKTYYAYCFEAKSIQSYLFKTGKLKDALAASERLDRLIDTEAYSSLAQVLNAQGISSDLCEPNPNAQVRFTRCKGGAMYAYADEQKPLQTLRQAWTALLVLYFPDLKFVDALQADSSIKEAIDKAKSQLQIDRQQPTLSLPIGTAIVQPAKQTGLASVQEEHGDYLDLDTSYQRQVYAQWNLKEKGQLQKKFLPEGCSLSFVEDLEQHCQAQAAQDMAMIHLDGNGIGMILQQLNVALNTIGDVQKYAETLRKFSEGLAKSTEIAAQQATQDVINKHQLSEKLAMRPLIMGGDDVTLLCDPSYALDWVKTFCRTFATESEKFILTLTKTQKLKLKTTKLTASGAILLHKYKHPFVFTHRTLEALTENAKAFSKAKDPKQPLAAVALYQVSNCIEEDFQGLVLPQSGTMGLNQLSWLLDSGHARSLENLESLLSCIQDQESRMSLSKWRHLASLVAQGLQEDAKAYFNKALDLTDPNPKQTSIQPYQPQIPEHAKALTSAITKIFPKERGYQHLNQAYFYCDQHEQQQSCLHDVLVLEKLTPASQSKAVSARN